MALLADTSVWSLAYRRDAGPATAEVEALRRGLTGGERIIAAGVVLLELLRGFARPKAQATIRADFDALEFIEPNRGDYVAAAALSNTCRRKGVQLPTIDSMIAQLCIAHDLVLLTTDADFHHAARHIPLQVWSG
jgi:predicted nucleic acid-binding protein